MDVSINDDIPSWPFSNPERGGIRLCKFTDLDAGSIASTQIYMHADLAVKQRALDKTMPLKVGPNRYRPADSLLAYLDTF
jgi:hypothetical protein